MKETGNISQSQYSGTTKRGICVLCGKDVSESSWEKQKDHALACLRKKENDKKQTRLF